MYADCNEDTGVIVRSNMVTVLLWIIRFLAGQVGFSR